jgi:hypothetical protein
LPELAAALRRHAEQLRSTDRAESDHLRRRAYRLARWSVRITRIVPAAYPFALRELSTHLAERGKLAKALRIADTSCAVALGQKAKYEHARSLLARAKIARQLALPEADEQIRTAEATIDFLEKPLARKTPTALSPY